MAVPYGNDKGKILLAFAYNNVHQGLCCDLLHTIYGKYLEVNVAPLVNYLSVVIFFCFFACTSKIFIH